MLSQRGGLSRGSFGSRGFGLSFRRRQGVPDPYSGIAGGGDEPRAVGAEGNLMHVARVAIQLADHLMCRRIPETNQVVGAGTGEAGAVGRESEIVYDRSILQNRKL